MQDHTAGSAANGPAGLTACEPPAPPDSGARTNVDSLGDSGEIFRLAFQHAPIGIALHGPATEWIEFNAALSDFFGYSREELLGKSFRDMTHPDDADIIRPYREKVLRGELPYFQAEKRYIHKSGAVIWGLMKVAAAGVDRHGNPLLISQIQDITEAKNAEFAKEEYERSLQASERRFRTAMQCAPTGMALARTDSAILDVNDAVCDLVGYSRDELKKLTFLDITHPDDTDIARSHLVPLVAREAESCQFEKRYIHKTGRIVWVQFDASLSGEKDEGMDVLICQFLDITERKALDEVKNEFVSVVSHELRTPLTSIRGSLGLILGAMREQLTSEIEQLLGIAHSNCERLIPLINDILDLDKIAAGKMRFDLAPEPVGSLVGGAVERNRAYADRFGVTLHIDTVDTGLQALTDTNRAGQVFDNLLSNAIKFTRAGGAVHIRAERRDHAIRFSVSDEGDGVPAEFADRIFTRFSQADSSVTREVEGTGLGLHISKQIVEKMRGRIGFDSRPGEGATFWFELPDITASSTTLLIGEAAANPDDDRPVILHVEDDLDFAHVLAAGLGDRCRFEVATSCALARAALAEQAYDLIIVDLDLQDGDPRDLLVSRGGPIDSNTPVVIVSNDEVPDSLLGVVAAAFVKARTRETEIRDRVLGCLQAA